MQHCLRHMEEPSTGECRSCHGTYCARCLVYSFGPKKPPYCVGCALRASGVRSGAKRNMQAAKLSVPTDEPTSFGSAPALFRDHSDHGGSAPPPTSGGTHATGSSTKSTWSQRRSERQAAKAARRAAKDPSTEPATAGRFDGGPLAGPAPAELELTAQERRALSRLSQISAGDLVR